MASFTEGGFEQADAEPIRSETEEVYFRQFRGRGAEGVLKPVRRVPSSRMFNINCGAQCRYSRAGL